MTGKAEKPIIAVDLDDVLAAHAEEFIKFSNEQFGTNLSVEDYRESWSEMWQVTPEEAEERALLWRTPPRIDSFRKLADEHIDTVLAVLKQRYKLVIVTARPKAWRDSTVAWVERHYPGVFSDIRLVPVWTNETPQTKAEVCKEIGAQYLIDDSIKHCNLAAEAGIKAILFEGLHPWKETLEPHSKVVRCKDWQEVLEYFDGQVAG